MTVNHIKTALREIDDAGLEMDLPHPVSDDDIIECEKYFGCALPESYRLFLLKLGFGGVEDVVFLGLVAGNVLKNGHVNALQFTLGLQSEFDLPPNLFAIENFDGDAVACLLLSKMKGGECPVVLWDHSERRIDQSKDPHVLAETFGEYFLTRVQELVEDEGLIESRKD